MNNTYNSKQKPPNLIKKWAKDVNRRFSEEQTPMADRQRKALSLTGRQGDASQNLERGHVTPNTTAATKPGKNKCGRGWGEIGTCALRVGTQDGAAAVETVRKLNIESLYAPAVPSWVSLPETESRILKSYVHLRVHCITLHGSQEVGATTCPSTDGQNAWPIRTMAQCSPWTRKGVLTPDTVWTGLEDTVPSERSRHRRTNLCGPMSRGT